MAKIASEALPQLAAMYYYQSKDAVKGVSFEQLEEDKKLPFLELAGSFLRSLEKLNLVLVRKSTKNEEEVKAILRDKVETAVREFFDGIKVWRKGVIPQEELVARIMQVWEDL